MNPPVKTNGEDAARFSGRDWRSVQVHEIIDPAETRFVELDSSIEETTKLLIRSGPPNVILIRESRTTKTPVGWFGYDELNAYLLLVLGLSQPDDSAVQLRERARSGEILQLQEVNDHLGAREEPIMLPHTANLTQAMEMLGGGVHRIVVAKEGTSEAVGILSQLRLVRFFWENHQNFAATERLYGVTLKELELGTKDVLAINGDRPLSDALRLMHDEGISSLPVLDSHNNVVGNISHVDTRVSITPPTLSDIGLSLTCFLIAAPHRHISNSAPLILLHSLHLSHSLRAWRTRRQRLLPCLPRLTLQHPRPHRREALCYPLTSYVDHRNGLAVNKCATKPWFRLYCRTTLQHAEL